MCGIVWVVAEVVDDVFYLVLWSDSDSAARDDEDIEYIEYDPHNNQLSTEDEVAEVVFFLVDRGVKFFEVKNEKISIAYSFSSFVGSFMMVG